MNTNRKPLGWKTVGTVVLLAALSAYQMWRSTERPVAGWPDPEATDATMVVADQQEESTAPRGSIARGKPPEAVGAYLVDGARGTKRSPAGLVYTPSASGEHRTAHVLQHAHDIPDRAGSHGVFDAQGDDVFRLLDEAYQLIRSKSSRVKTEPSDEDFKKVYVVQMQRRIGYRGGASGARSGHPALTRIKLVLADDRVITAYPY